MACVWYNIDIKESKMIVYIDTKKAKESYLKKCGAVDNDYEFAIQLVCDLITQAKRQDNILEVNKKIPFNC